MYRLVQWLLFVDSAKPKLGGFCIAVRNIIQAELSNPSAPDK